jgi:hypothetical protein
MVTALFFSQLVLVALVWLCVILHWEWLRDATTVGPTPHPSTPPRRKHSREPKPIAGLTRKPHCDACEHASDLRSEAPCTPPPRIVPTWGRRRQVDTSTHFRPNPDCAYRGWTGWGNLRANGHPNGGPWRQLLCVACRRYFLEALGTLFYGKRASVELIVRVIACLAAPLRAVGAATPPPGPRPCAQAALDAVAAPALRAGGQDRAAPAFGGRDTSRGVRDSGCCQSGASAVRLADQHRFRRAGSTSPSASMWQPWDDGSAHSARARTACSSSSPCIMRIIILSPSRLLAPAAAAVPTQPWHGVSQAVAAVYASYGSGADRPCLDTARGVAVPRAAMAPASRGMSKPRWWAAIREGGLGRRRVSTRPALRASPAGRGPLGGHDAPLAHTFLPL